MDEHQNIRPFLKWAGNKYRVMEAIRKALPSGKRLIEPFTGSGAVFLNTGYTQYYLAESNKDLITLFNLLKVDGDKFIAYVKTFFAPCNNTSKKYYELRHQFNDSQDLVLRAALFIYLNKHCYNGLCRYNKKAGFNVPYGRYKKPYFPEAELHTFCKKSTQAEFVLSDFVETMQSACVGDVVYCDPPYVPLSDTANFTQYNNIGFTHEQQVTLSELARDLAGRNIPVVISNHNTEVTQALYRGATLHCLDVRRTISCQGSQRHKVPELIAVFR